MASFVPPNASATAARPIEHRGNGWSAHCLRLADLAIAGAIFVIPLLLGGIRPLPQLLLVVLAIVAAGAWLLAQLSPSGSGWRWLGVEPLLLAAIALVGLQLIPLPAEVRQVLSPKLADTLPLWGDHATAASLDEWRTLSVAPAATRNGLINLIAYSLLFLVIAQRVRTTDDARRLLHWVAWSAAGMAAFGLAQYFASNDKFYWFYAIPPVTTSQVVHGSFVNRNHLAHFLALGVGPLLAVALGSAPGSFRNKALHSRNRGGRRGPRRLAPFLAWAGLACVVAAAALSLSRGGALAVCVAALVCIALCRRAGVVNFQALPGLLLVAGGLCGAMFLPGSGGVENRVVESVRSLDVETFDEDRGRRNVWESVSKVIADFPIVGAGVGSHRHVYQMYHDHPDDGLEYNSADSGFLQLTAETGLAGLTLALTAFALMAARCLRAGARAANPAEAVCLAAVLAGVAASCVHSAVETPWFMPGCMVLLTTLAACGIALTAGRGDRAAPRRIPRAAWGLAWLGLVALGAQMLPVKQQLLNDWQSWQALDAVRQSKGSITPEDGRLLLSRLRLLSSATVHNPRFHLSLAHQYLQLFERLQQSGDNSMTLTEIREAAEAGGFENGDELHDWLSRALSGNEACLFAARDHAARCLELCPVEGLAYVFQSELCFLAGREGDTGQDYVRQALRVRPYDAEVLFHAGQIEWRAGRAAAALAYWKDAFQRSRNCQATISALLLHSLPAEFFLETFEPDWSALREMRQFIRAAGRPDDPVITRRFAEVTVARAHALQDRGAVDLLLEAARAYRDIADGEAALGCVTAALDASPNSYEARIAVARCLQTREEYQAAAEHLRWCLQRRPNDAAASELLRAIMAKSLRLESADPLPEVAVTSMTPALIGETSRFDDLDPSFGGHGTDRLQQGTFPPLADFENPLPRKE